MAKMKDRSSTKRRKLRDRQAVNRMKRIAVRSWSEIFDGFTKRAVDEAVRRESDGFNLLDNGGNHSEKFSSGLRGPQGVK